MAGQQPTARKDRNLLKIFSYTLGVASCFCPLSLRLLWTFLSKSFCEHVFSFLLGKDPGAELRAAGRVDANLTEKGQSVLQVLFRLTPPREHTPRSCCSTSCQHLVLSAFGI